ncbi:MAG: orotidine 5'-phosphate decarboxylase [Candidatus Bathyarchaeota archaeon]|nr:orotidine 5'-phosphate decarboxylase [Candidatus Bathyarchaeota archaeon]
MSAKGFQARIEEASESHTSKIVLALDYVLNDREALFRRSLQMVETLAPHLCAVKINRHLVLPLGLHPHVERLVTVAHDLDLPAIMDCKINDIGDTNHEIARRYFEAGFDAVTANPFIGWEGGLEPVFKLAGESGKGVILLVYMSHRSAGEGYGQKVVDSRTGHERRQYLVFAERAVAWGADGVVVGATYPEKIREVNQVLKDRIPIFSPGIGVQGGALNRVAEAGASYFIIGRSILLSPDPLEAVKAFKEGLDRE